MVGREEDQLTYKSQDADNLKGGVTKLWVDIYYYVCAARKQHFLFSF